MSRIVKIKMKDDVVEIHTEDKTRISERESIFKCKEKAHPDLVNAFTALVPEVYDILQLPRDWRAGCVTVIGVSFSLSEETQVEGAVITALVGLDTTNAPLVINSPHLPFEQYSDGGESPLMSERAQQALEQLRQEALEYMSGKKRAQVELALK